jgi:hypothetical protein
MEEPPEWFVRWFEYYKEDEPITHSRLDWQREAWAALRRCWPHSTPEKEG